MLRKIKVDKKRVRVQKCQIKNIAAANSKRQRLACGGRKSRDND